MTERFQRQSKHFSLGRLWYFAYHYPKGVWQRSRKRNPVLQLGDHLAMKEMERSAKMLPPIDTDFPSHSIHFLTGSKYWYQTCFCAYSLMKHIGIPLRLVLYDDGSLSSEQAAHFRQIFPVCDINSLEDIRESLESILPESRYPTLRARRREYPHLRKLTDVHSFGGGWKLVLDSDMLCFREPSFVRSWLENPSEPCCMRDIETSYGYSSQLLNRLSVGVVPEKVNVGICGLNSDDVDWDRMEYWAKVTLEEEGSQYTQEQALVALYLSERSYTEAAASEYVVFPSKEEVISPRAILHHYVASSKPWYFRYGWKHIVATDEK